MVYYKNHNFIKNNAFFDYFLLFRAINSPFLCLCADLSGCRLAGSRRGHFPDVAVFPDCLKGMQINPHNPFQFNFILDAGDEQLDPEDRNDQVVRLAKYFLAGLTIPEEDLWVNLSPYEKDRIIAGDFARTEMGRDVLAQDYMLKQLTASLMDPRQELGSHFWQRLKKRAKDEYGVADITADTIHKVWIVPERAEVTVGENGVFLGDLRLQVMLEEDYLARAQERFIVRTPRPNTNTALSTELMRELIIPAIEEEVNQGRTFATLRQIYGAMVLSVWFKNHLKESLLTRGYAD